MLAPERACTSLGRTVFRADSSSVTSIGLERSAPPNAMEIADL